MTWNSIAGVVLAGGQSSRMGFDKSLAELAGQPLISHVAARLAPQVAELAISSNEPGAAAAALGLPLLADRDAGRPGPLAGILAGMEWAAGRGHMRIVTAAVDTPFLPADLVERLARDAGAAGVAIAASGGRLHPAFGLWPVALAEALSHHLEHSEDRSVIGFARACGFVEADFPHATERDPFFNVNTPDELEEARRLVAQAVT